jgi:type IV secretion system protein VirD4
VFKLLFRLIIALWPLWAWIGVRSLIGGLMEGTSFYGAALTVAPLILYVVVVWLGRRSPNFQRLTGLAAIGALVSGVYGLYSEYGRWEAYLNYYPNITTWYILRYLDWPLVLVSLVCIAIPAALMFGQKMSLKGILGWGDGLKRSTIAHGSAVWLTPQAALQVLNQGTMVVGEAYNPKDHPELGGSAPLLRFDGRGHLLTVAGSGGGKTTSVAIPNCLTWDGNMVVHDPKGELARMCRRARQKRGKSVIVLDPLRDNTDTINVLSWLDPDSDGVIENARAVVSWLGTGEEPKGENAYFKNAGKNLILALLLDVVCDRDIPPEHRTLELVRKRVAHPDLPSFLGAIHGKGNTIAYGVAAELAGELKGIADRAQQTWAGIQGEASELTAWLTTPSLTRLVCGTGKGRQVPITALVDVDVDIFICVPLRTLDSTPAVARLIFGALLNAVYEYYQRHGRAARRCLFLIDEMPRLRKMELLETARDAGRGLGVTLWSIVQDLGQLEKHYGKEGLRGWMESSQIKTYFGVGDVETAEMLSKAMDESTIEIETSGRSKGSGGKATELFGTANVSENVNSQLLGRRLMTPGEIMNMRVDENGVPDEQLLFLRGRAPLRCGMAKWYRRPEWAALVDQA